MAVIGSAVTQGFHTITQVPIEAAYLDFQTPWANEAEALAGIPVGNRYPGQQVDIAGVLYWFLDDLATLEPIAISNDQTASEVPITDAGEFFEADNVEDALQEIGSELVTINTALETLKSNPYQINMPAGNLTTKVSGASFLPTGWATVIQSGDYDAMVTHILTGRKVGFVNVFEIDGSNERLLSFDKGTAYTGIVGNGLTIKLEGLAPTTLPIRIEFIID